MGEQVDVFANEVRRLALRALVDSGCSTTICAFRAGKCTEKIEGLVAVGGKEAECEGNRKMQLTVQGIWLKTKVVVLSKVFDGINIIIRMDVIIQLGGVMIEDGRVMFGIMPACYQVVRQEVLCAVAVEDVGGERECSEANGRQITQEGDCKGCV